MACDERPAGDHPAAVVRPGGRVLIIAAGAGSDEGNRADRWATGAKVAIFLGDVDNPADREAAEAMADELFGRAPPDPA